MSKPPVIFVSFANNHLKPLPSLKKEGTLIQQLFSSAADNQQIQFHLEAFASTDNLTNYFIQYKDRIRLFHYGGHANSKSFLLNDQKANAQGIAHQLAQQKPLKLVFLNGCSTRKQVDLLLELGIPAVIATSVPIGDKSATHFAEKFYAALVSNHTLKTAFEMAAANFETKYNHRPEIFRDTGVKGEETEELPWGLYTNNKDDVLNLPFIPKKMKKKPTTKNINKTNGDGNVVIQGVSSKKGDVNISVNQTSQPKNLKTQALEKILQLFSTSAITPFKKWVSPYLFGGDDTIEQILSNKDFPVTSKKDIVSLKLDRLLQDAAFKKALQKQLGIPVATENQKNNVTNSSLEAGGKIHIGDVNTTIVNQEDWTTKNAVIGSTIKAGKGIRIGDTNTKNDDE